MAQRVTPEHYFATRELVQTPEPLPVVQVETAPLQVYIDPNMMMFAIVGVVAVVGLIGLLAYLGSRK